MSKWKIGCFRISRDLLDNHLEIVQEIMAQVIVVRAELHYDTNCIHYTALGGCFEELDRSYEAPDYVIDCEEAEDGRPLIFVKGEAQSGDWLQRKLYSCTVCCDEGRLGCPKCSGSGEGMADGSRCLDCDDGAVPCGCVETNHD